MGALPGVPFVFDEGLLLQKAKARAAVFGAGKELKHIQLVMRPDRGDRLPEELQPAHHMPTEARADLGTEGRAGMRSRLSDESPELTQCLVRNALA